MSITLTGIDFTDFQNFSYTFNLSEVIDMNMMEAFSRTLDYLDPGWGLR